MIKRQDYRALYLIYSVENGHFQVDFSAFLRLLKKRPYCVQYRAKNNSYQFDCTHAKKLKHLCTRYKVPFIINDSMQLARRVGADGLHIGQEDGTLPYLKRQLNWHIPYSKKIGEKSSQLPIVGVSCYDSLSLAMRAKQQGADYIAFGALFPSPTKPTKNIVSIRVVKKAQALSLPVVVIGGITAHNFNTAKTTKAQAYAMISGINAF